MVNIKWSTVVPKAVKVARAFKEEYGEAPTLRGIYYSLVSIEAIPNIYSAYKGLSRTLTKARIKGDFPWSLMQDKTREATEKGNEKTVEECVEWAEESVSDYLESLKEAFEQIENPTVDWSPGRWTAQPNRVLIAVEKEAIMGAIKNVLRGWDVQIFPLRGYTSTTFIKQMANRIVNLSNHGRVKLVIVTDYDPSGEDMVRDLQDRLYYDHGVSCDAEKVLLTKDQIQEYDLPAIPEDAEEIAKMRRDPRFNQWEDGVFRVELDAMAAIEPKAFRSIMQESVEKHFDEDIEEENKAEVNEANYNAERELRQLYQQLKSVHHQVIERIKEIEGDQ